MTSLKYYGTLCLLIMPLMLTFKHNNDPKHTSKLSKKVLKEYKIKVMSGYHCHLI